MANLPPLNAAQAEHVAKLRGHLQALARREFLSFERFMHEALYAPGLGYYVSGNQKFGADFTTAPELSPLFGQTLLKASQLQLQQYPKIVELGAGSGALAESILQADATISYDILELSPELKARQQKRLAGYGERVQWLTQLPEKMDGVVLANEVLDAVPCALVRYQNGVEELGYDDQLRLISRPVTGHLLGICAARLPQQAGYTSELNPQAEALVASITERMGNALAFWIDYGFPRREYYHPDRHMGTVMCHYQQVAHSEPLFAPGVQDITAHIDFTAMAEAAVDAGGEIVLYASQAQFLIAAGITDLLPEQASTEYLKTTNVVNRLLHPAEMGELFKLLVVGKGQYTLPKTIENIDQSYRL